MERDYKHPYLRGVDFWGKEINQFWKTDNYTKKGKGICMKMVDDIKNSTKTKMIHNKHIK